jgi:poly(glycerol-phosphate) alpha-glucosyltransferase
VSGPQAFGYARDLSLALDLQADLLYAATLWRYPSWAALKWAQKTGKPMIVAPHGSLDAWALRNSFWKKRLAARLFKDRQLQAAFCLRALSESEADSLRVYGLRNPIAIIPNGITLTEENGRHERRMRASVEAKTLLFLGRVHPKKGLVNLLRAWHEVKKREGWRLLIAGWDQGGHQQELEQLCRELRLRFETGDQGAEVIFTGPLFDEKKKALLRSSDALILPSWSEGLPMAVLEAWADGIPVLMTPECHLSEGFLAAAAVRIETNSASIAQGLRELFSMSDGEREEMGLRGRNLVAKNFTWQKAALLMKEVYDWALGGGSPPECVRK